MNTSGVRYTMNHACLSNTHTHTRVRCAAPKTRSSNQWCDTQHVLQPPYFHYTCSRRTTEIRARNMFLKLLFIQFGIKVHSDFTKCKLIPTRTSRFLLQQLTHSAGLLRDPHVRFQIHNYPGKKNPIPTTMNTIHILTPTEYPY
jgi:hypothetical protein